MAKILTSRSRLVTRQIRETRGELEEAEEIIDRLAVVDDILAQIEKVEEQASQLDQLRQTVLAIEKASDFLAHLQWRLDTCARQLKGSGKISEVETELQKREDIVELVDEVTKVDAKIGKLGELLSFELPDPGKLEKDFAVYDNLREVLRVLEEVNQRTAKLQGIIDQAKSWLEDLDIKLHEMETELGVCPLCGANLT